MKRTKKRTKLKNNKNWFFSMNNKDNKLKNINKVTISQLELSEMINSLNDLIDSQNEINRLLKMMSTDVFIFLSNRKYMIIFHIYN